MPLAATVILPPRRRRALARTGAGVALLLCAMLVVAVTRPTLSRAQEARVVSRLAQAQVEVYQDNLDDARRRSVRAAQAEAVRGVLGDVLADEWRQLFADELEKTMLSRPEKYINAYRVELLTPSADLTRYRATLQVQVDRQQMAEDIREELGLPVKGGRTHSVTLLYSADDPLLRDSSLRQAVFAALGERLSLLNYRVTAVDTVSGAAATVLRQPYQESPLRPAVMRRLAERRTDTVLFLGFSLPAMPVPGAQGTPVVRAAMYQPDTGEPLAAFDLHAQAALPDAPLGSSQVLEQVRTEVMQPLLTRMQPGAFTAPTPTAEDTGTLRIRVVGFNSVAEEELFESAFFGNDSRFQDFRLDRVEPRAVTYSGTFDGDREALARDLRGSAVGDFYVQEVYWQERLLELDVFPRLGDEFTEMRSFLRPQRAPESRRLIEQFLENTADNPVMDDPGYAEREDNGWTRRANQVPLGQTFYGFVDARADSDFYVVEALQPGDRLVIHWVRLERTNLRPTVRLYDAEGQLVRTHHMNSWLRSTYRVPRGEHRFYVEVADRFGYTGGDTGGYLSFPYLMLIQRVGE